MIPIKIIGGRQTGKTTMLVKLSGENKIPIACTDMNRAKDILDIAKKLGYKNFPTPVVLNIDYTIKRDLRDEGGVLIDDADLFLEKALNANVVAITLEGEGFPEVNYENRKL